ncbi:MAG: VOC family protein [Burkholderiales bacterium]|nr:VOC family protein [Burkholderiales bacterium]
MNIQNYIILYVDDPQRSATFYSRLLWKPPVESSPTFCLFELDSGVMLGLWSKHTVEPAPAAVGSGSEVAFSVASHEAVEAIYNDWVMWGMKIAQRPTQMDFGYTFVALDPDQHRLRVFVLTEPATDPVPEAALAA